MQVCTWNKNKVHMLTYLLKSYETVMDEEVLYHHLVSAAEEVIYSVSGLRSDLWIWIKNQFC